MIYTQELKDASAATPLLAAVGIERIEQADYTVGLFDGDRLVGIGSLKDGIIQGIAVDPDIQGGGLANRIITELIEHATRLGLETLYLFTKPDKTLAFAPMGFRELAIAPPYAVMMEWGANSMERYLAGLVSGVRPTAAAIVMNANPFTKGHLYLAEKASVENDLVYLFAVREDKSVFPFSVRYHLMQQGVSHLRNVRVLDGGRYIVSSLTFPSYFTKREDQASAHAALDVALFGSRIAPALNIRKRYVGTEPHSPVTNVYNTEMKRRLPVYGVAVEEVPRKETGEDVISASTVRRLIGEGRVERTEAYLPPTTYAFLQSDEAKPILARIREEAGNR